MSQTRPNHILLGTFVCMAILWSSISLGAPVAVIPISPIQLSGSTTLIDFNDDGWNDAQLRNERFGPNQSYYYEDEFGYYSETETISYAWGTILATFDFGTSEYNEATFHTNLYESGQIISATGNTSLLFPDIFDEYITEVEECDFFLGCSNYISGITRTEVFPDSGVFPGPEESVRGFMGFGFEIDSALHFGWLDVGIISLGPEETSAKDVYIHGWGYETTPFTPIAAGAGVVPIPATAWLFCSGLLGLLGISRHKKLLK